MQSLHWARDHCRALACRVDGHTVEATQAGLVGKCRAGAGLGSEACREGVVRCMGNMAVDMQGWFVERWMDL